VIGCSFQSNRGNVGAGALAMNGGSTAIETCSFVNNRSGRTPCGEEEVEALW
jgi:hypothetical protein